MREGAAAAIFDPSAVFLEIPGIPWAVLQAVHRAVTEQAVEICKSLVAGEIFTISVLKKRYEFSMLISTSSLKLLPPCTFHGQSPALSAVPPAGSRHHLHPLQHHRLIDFLRSFRCQRCHLIHLHGNYLFLPQNTRSPLSLFYTRFPVFCKRKAPLRGRVPLFRRDLCIECCWRNINP